MIVVLLALSFCRRHLLQVAVDQLGDRGSHGHQRGSFRWRFRWRFGELRRERVSPRLRHLRVRDWLPGLLIAYERPRPPLDWITRFGIQNLLAPLQVELPVLRILVGTDPVPAPLPRVVAPILLLPFSHGFSASSGDGTRNLRSG